MLQKVKLALRITNSHFDEEIQDIIDACYLDLEISGATKLSGTYEKLVNRAVILYAKAQFGLENPDSEKFQNSYEALKRQLTLSGDITS